LKSLVGGFDNRFGETRPVLDSSDYFNWSKLLKQKLLMDMLTDESVGLFTKLNVLKEYDMGDNLSSHNLSKGLKHDF
jgi:hypothetical protein